MLDSKSLWATNLHYLNDATEITYAREPLRHAIFHMGDHIDDSFVPRRKEHKQLTQALLEAASAPLRFEAYVFSLSEEKDLLSQWRAYCPHTGYAIGFRVSALQALAAKAYSLARCEYDLGAHWGPAVRAHVRDVHAAFETMRLASIATNEAIEVCSARLLALVHPYVTTLKHPAFYEEREWRLVSGHGRVPRASLKHRVSASMLIPYAIIPFDGKERDLISEIVVGPTPLQALSLASIEGLAQRVGLASNISTSKVPYRNL